MAASVDPDVLYVSGLVAAIFRSPTWVMPISAFVDENCGSFEDQEENKLEYTLIHNAFKHLIDDLLEAHLEELNVTQEQFTRFCEHGLHGDNEFHKELVEQLLSVDDFLVFKAMLVRRNAQLYRQAHDMFGLTASPSDFGGTGLGGGPSTAPLDMSAADVASCQGRPTTDAEREAMQRLEAAELEAERLDLQRRCVEAELQLAMALSLQLKKRLQLMEALSEVLEALAEMKEGSLEALAAEAASEEAPYQVQPLYIVTTSPQQEEVEAMEAALQRERAERAVAASRQTAAAREAEAAARTAAAKAAALAAAAVPQGPSEEERRERAEHLKRQRDLLVQKKNRDREQQLTAFQQSHGPTLAARAAEVAIARPQGIPGADGRRLAEELSGKPANPVPDASGIQDKEGAAAEMRRALTRQLKATLTGSALGR